MNRREILIAVTNDIVSDQRVQKVASTFGAHHNVTIVGVDRGLNYDDGHVRLKVSRQKGPRFYYSFNQRLAKLITQRSPDIIYACDPDSLYGVLKSIKAKQKLIYDSHELFIETPELMNRPLHKAVWRAVEARGVRRSNARITVANGIARRLEQMYSASFEVVRNVPIKSMISNDVVMKSNVLLYQGVLNEGRGLREMITAMKQLNGYVLKLAGVGDLKIWAQEYAKQIGVDDRVEFLGRIAPHKLIEITNEAKYGLNLIAGSSENYRLSLANKFFDYMNAGIPSINMNFPEYQEILSTYPIGVTISVLSADSIIKCVESLDKQPASFFLQHKSACKLAQAAYNWENESKVLLRILDRLYS